MPLEHVEHAARVLQAGVALGRAARVGRVRAGNRAALALRTGTLRLGAWSRRLVFEFVLPRAGVVLAALGIETAEKAVEVFGVFEIRIDQKRSVGVVQDVFFEV